MKIRILSLLLALVLLLGMLPVSAFAAETAADAVVEITHISLNPSKDALGFKAKVTGNTESITEIGFSFRVEGGSFGVQSAYTNNLKLGDPYEVDYKLIFEKGIIYLELDGELVYKFQSTFTNGIYYFGVTQYADATYTNTQVTYDAEEIAAMTAQYKN